VKKESWDSSTENAKTLKIEDFGTSNEVREIAKPIRTAKNRYEATVILKEIAAKGPLTNKNGLTVTLSSDSSKNNAELKARRYLYAPLEFDNKIIPVKITVKEYNDESLGKRLYSIEAIDVEMKTKI